MKKVHLLCSLFLIYGHEKVSAMALCQQFQRTGTSYTAISIILQPREEVILNSFVLGSKQLSFKNNTSKEAIITHRVHIIRPTHLFYSKGREVDGKLVARNKSILLFPGDSIALKSNQPGLQFATTQADNIDELLTIPSLCYPSENVSEMMTLEKSDQTDSILRSISIIFQANTNKIQKLNVPNGVRATLNNFNRIIKYTQISRLPYANLDLVQQKMVASLTADLQNNAEILTSINTPFLPPIAYYLIQTNLYKKHESKKDFWLSFNDVDTAIKEADYFKIYMLSRVINAFNYYPGSLRDVYRKMTLIKPESRLLDTLRELTKILLYTFQDFTLARRDLQNFNNGKYAYLLNNEQETNHEYKYIHSLAQTLMRGVDNKGITLQKVLNGKARLYVLDFWASWCGPCISDYPHLHKIAQSMKGMPVKFISVSIDKEANRSQWISKLKQFNSYDTSCNFILANAENSPVNQFFNIQTIPRYILVDNTGKVIDEDFVRPSSPEFKRKLEAYISQN